METPEEIHTALKQFISSSVSKGTASTQTVDFLTRFHDYRPIPFRRQPRLFSAQPCNPPSPLIPTEKAVETAPLRLIPATKAKPQHHRFTSLQSANDYGYNGKKIRGTRVAGVLGTHTDFLKVRARQKMTAERKELERSLEATQKEWGKLRYALRRESSGLRGSKDTTLSQSVKTKPQRKTYKKETTTRPMKPVDCNLSYRRVLSTAQSPRRRKIADHTWRSQLSESPTKRQQSEGNIDLGSLSVSEYFTWFRTHPRPASKASTSKPTQPAEPEKQIKFTVKITTEEPDITLEA